MRCMFTYFDQGKKKAQGQGKEMGMPYGLKLIKSISLKFIGPIWWKHAEALSLIILIMPPPPPICA